jgi:tRNA threonylcarbamoyl adenosine modification protein YeaZ
MKILAIETTGPLASVALIDQDGSITERAGGARYSHLEGLIPMIRLLLSDAQTEPQCLAAIAVSRGPGSFTGVRIGMTTAKALAQVWQKPVVQVPTLDSFAFHERVGEGILAVPILDARRSQIYAGAYRKTREQKILPCIEEKAWSPAEFLELLAERQEAGETALFCGDGAGVHEALLSRHPKPFFFCPAEESGQQAAWVARLGLQLYLAGCRTDAFSAEPVYLRQPEAERKLQEKWAK